MVATTHSGLSVSQGGFQELKGRILFLVAAVFVFRLGVHIPVPGLDPQKVADLFGSQQNNILGMFNMFSGGALKQMSIFALGVMPYISASIIMQLFSAISPKLEQLKKEGEAGRRVINQYTRYGTLGLAFFQAFGLSKYLASGGIAVDPSLNFYFVAAVTMATGTMFLMWMGEQVTERGIGNGISMIIFAGIVSGLPGAFAGIFERVKEGTMQGFTLIMIGMIVIGVTAIVVFIEQGQRRIAINYAKRQQGRKMYAPQSSHLPLKLNMAGVIPPIFANAIIVFAATAFAFFGAGEGRELIGDIGTALGPGQPVHIMLFIVAIVFFCFFYTAIVFNPRDTADNLKRSGAFIPGIRPGEQTANYIDNVMTRLTFFGAMYLIMVALVPEFLRVAWNVPFYFGGTSLLIIVVVLMDFMAQVQALMMSHQYEALLKKAKLKGDDKP